MKIEIDLTPMQIANAIISEDYPQQAVFYDALAHLMEVESENPDKKYRWCRYLISNMTEDGKNLIRDLHKALKDSEK